MNRWIRPFLVLVALGMWIAGCFSGFGLPLTGDQGLATVVAGKAVNIADLVGGTNGFGGMMMDGYMQHAESMMGFHGSGDLADPNGSDMPVTLHNHSDEDCTFHLTYFTSHMGLDEQVMDVMVTAGLQTTVEIPCSEIIGMGPLEMPGEAGCHLASGEAVANTMAVPCFLGMDYTCGATHEFHLKPDTDDLDGDGDTEELIILSDAMQDHMASGGPMGHMHGGGGMMMGGHMGGF
ncbi:MAG: hypothetical protein ACYTF1_00955 [Planctomycetota bacterium]|jgi:hypothetical protein